MNHTYHYFLKIIDGVTAYAWCGVSNTTDEGQVRMVTSASQTNCEACKEAVAIHLLAKVGT